MREKPEAQKRFPLEISKNFTTNILKNRKTIRRIIFQLKYRCFPLCECAGSFDMGRNDRGLVLCHCGRDSSALNALHVMDLQCQFVFFSKT